MERPIIILFPEYSLNVSKLIDIPLLCGNWSYFPNQSLKGACLECPHLARVRRNLPLTSISGCLDTHFITLIT